MEFFTVTAQLNYGSYGDFFAESFLDKVEAIKFVEKVEREYRNQVCGDLEFEADEYFFGSDDILGRVKHIHLESNTGEETAYIELNMKTFKDGVN
jgi:hypothetical protein